MLILSRRVGESIRINDDIQVFITGCRDGQIKIGVQAPRDVEVHREEIYQRIAREKGK